MPKLYVKEIKDKDRIHSTFLVARKTNPVDKNGKPYLSLLLQDKTGDIDARAWDGVAEMVQAFEQSDVVEVEGLANLYQGRLQLRIDSLRKSDGAGLDPADYMPASSADAETMFAEVLAIVDTVSDGRVRALLRSFLDDEALARDFKRAPAAKSIHHAYLGGLLEHTLSVLKLAQRLVEHYPMADRDLMLCGALLHDIGKTRELSYERGFGYTDEGRLVGHLVMTAQWVHDRAKQIEGFTPELEQHIVHLVLSHHGELEFGSPKLPQTLEAMLVHYVDEIDSRVSSWLSTMANDPGERWTDFNKLYDRYLWKGPLPTEGGKAPVPRGQAKRASTAAPRSEPKLAAASGGGKTAAALTYKPFAPLKKD